MKKRAERIGILGNRANSNRKKLTREAKKMKKSPQEIVHRTRGRDSGSMSIHHALFKLITKLGLILMMGASMSACGSGSEKWKEEVQLSDGRVVVVARELITESGGDEWAFNRSGSKPKEYLIRFEYPGGSGELIEWHSIKKSPQTWPELPLIFDISSEQPVVYAIVAISSVCEVYSKYVYQNGAWIEEALPAKFETRLTNLFLKTGTNMPNLVNLETKHKINSSVDYRRSLKQVGPSLKICG